jgi:hypothetical protein
VPIPPLSLEAEGAGAGAGADGAFLHRAGPCGAEGFEEMLLAQGSFANVVEVAIVGLTHDRVDGAHRLVAGPGQGVVGQGRGCFPNVQGVGQQERGFELPEFVYLGRADQFAEAVAHHDGGRDFLLEEVAAVGEDGGGAGADVVSFNQGDVAHTHAGDIGDGVQGAGGEDARGDAQFAGARAGGGFRRLGGNGGNAEQKQGRQAEGTHDSSRLWCRADCSGRRRGRQPAVPPPHL